MKFSSKLIRKMVSFNCAVKDRTGGQYKVLKRDYLPHGQIPVIDQGQKFIAGYTNNHEAIYKGELPVVLFGDHTLAFKYVDFPFGLMESRYFQSIEPLYPNLSSTIGFQFRYRAGDTVAILNTFAR